MGFFDDIGGFIGDIAGPAGTIIGGAVGGPAGATIGGAIGGGVSSLLGGGSSGASMSRGAMSTGEYNDVAAQQSELLDKLLGYETAGSKFLEDYTLNVFMDAEDDYLDSKRSKNTFNNIMDAVQSETIDPFTAQQFLSSKFRPNSEFYSTDDFAKLLDAEVGDKKQNLLCK